MKFSLVFFAGLATATSSYSRPYKFAPVSYGYKPTSPAASPVQPSVAPVQPGQSTSPLGSVMAKPSSYPVLPPQMGPARYPRPINSSTSPVDSPVLPPQVGPARYPRPINSSTSPVDSPVTRTPVGSPSVSLETSGTSTITLTGTRTDRLTVTKSLSNIQSTSRLGTSGPESSSSSSQVISSLPSSSTPSAIISAPSTTPVSGGQPASYYPAQYPAAAAIHKSGGNSQPELENVLRQCYCYPV